jgi:hypothetical protein
MNMGSKISIVLCSIFLTANVFACIGGGILQLNDSKHFDAWSLVNEVTGKKYYFSHDVGSCFNIADGSGVKTHRYCVEGTKNLPEVVLMDLVSGEKTRYAAMHPDVRQRGCNELTKI